MRIPVTLSCALLLASCATIKQYDKHAIEIVDGVAYDKALLEQDIKSPITGTVHKQTQHRIFQYTYKDGKLRRQQDHYPDGFFSYQAEYDEYGLLDGEILRTDSKENGETGHYSHGILHGQFHEWHNTSGLVFDRTFTLVNGVRKEQLNAFPDGTWLPRASFDNDFDIHKARHVPDRFFWKAEPLDHYTGWAWNVRNGLGQGRFKQGRMVERWYYDKKGYLLSYKHFAANGGKLQCKFSDGYLLSCQKTDAEGRAQGSQLTQRHRNGEFRFVERHIKDGVLDGRVRVWDGKKGLEMEKTFFKGVLQDNLERMERDLELPMPWVTPKMQPGQMHFFKARYQIGKTFSGWALVQDSSDGELDWLGHYRDGEQLEIWDYRGDNTLQRYTRYLADGRKIMAKYRDGVLASYEEMGANGSLEGRKLERRYRKEQYTEYRYEAGRQVGKKTRYSWDEQGELIVE